MRNSRGQYVKGHSPSPETIEKIRKARASQVISHSKETRVKMSLAQAGKKLSEETKAKIGTATIGKKYPKHINKKKGSPLERNPNWKGGRFKNKRGYLMVNIGSNKYMPEHRLIMETFLNRKLSRTEVVHHKNKMLDDNRIENLQLFKNQSEHIKSHLTAIS